MLWHTTCLNPEFQVLTKLNPCPLAMNPGLSYHKNAEILLSEIIPTGQIMCSMFPKSLIPLLSYTSCISFQIYRPIPLISSLDPEYSLCIESQQLGDSLYLNISSHFCRKTYAEFQKTSLPMIQNHNSWLCLKFVRLDWKVIQYIQMRHDQVKKFSIITK